MSNYLDILENLGKKKNMFGMKFTVFLVRTVIIKCPDTAPC